MGAPQKQEEIPILESLIFRFHVCSRGIPNSQEPIEQNDSIEF